MDSATKVLQAFPEFGLTGFVNELNEDRCDGDHCDDDKPEEPSDDDPAV